MATSQQYSLRWNNYLKHITYAFDNLRSQDDFVDVTLCCDGRKIKAHKLLLSACSGYFKEIFQENPHPHPVIIFKFIKYEDLLAIIEFMYQGEVNVQQEALQSFLQTAELLAVQGLTSEEKDSKPKLLIKQPVQIQTNISTQQQQQRNTSGIINDPLLIKTPTTIPTATIRAAQDNNVQTIELENSIIPSNNNVSSKKRKITFSDEDELYAESDFVKDESTPVKSPDIQYISSAVKVDMSEFIEVTEGNQLADENNPHNAQQTSQDTTSQTTQFTSTYEILTESELGEKYPNVAENSEIAAVEMGPIFNTQTTTGEIKQELKNNQDASNNKWTECQFCKMVITTVNLWRHIRTQHTSEPPRICEYCKKKFKNKYSLREHIRISHEQKQPKVSATVGTK